jgi:hypothetical protein
VEFAAELEGALREFTAASAVEVRENGNRVAPFTGLSWEVRGNAGKPLLHLWSERYNLTRRVLAITDHSEVCLTLAVERFGRAKPDRLEFVRVQFERPARELAREEFCERLRRILAEQFPDETLESLTISPDLEHSLSGNYARGLLRRGSVYWAVLGVPDGESSDATDNSLTFALLWLDRARQSCRRGTVAGVRIIFAKGVSRLVSHRIGALHRHLEIELYGRDAQRDVLERVDASSAGNLETWLVPRREAQSLLDQARTALDPIMAMAPRAITLHPSVQTREVWLRFRGLGFARWEDGRVFYGVDSSEQLTTASGPALKRLLHELEIHRHPLASDTRHSLYRAQAERWMESMVREDVTRVDAALDARFVYAQVFANSGGEHGIFDLLTATRNGRLAILELKAGEHIHLPLQAADYWLRVRRHLEQGHFARYGYFAGIELQPAPPLVYLVAPALRFHPATDTLLRHLTPQLEIVRVGLAESWRPGLRVVIRQ